VTEHYWSHSFLALHQQCQIDSNNNIIISTFVKRHKVVTSEALAAVICVCWLLDLRNKNDFSLYLKTDSESLPMTDAGNEFQTGDAAHRKEFLFNVAHNVT